MEDYIWKPCFVQKCLLTWLGHISFWLFCPALQLGYFHRTVPFVSHWEMQTHGEIQRSNLVKKNKPSCCFDHHLMEKPARLEDFGRLNIGNGSREGDPRWRCVNVWLCTLTSVISRAAYEGKRCQLWHWATSNCLAKALRVNSPDSFPDKSVS